MPRIQDGVQDPAPESFFPSRLTLKPNDRSLDEETKLKCVLRRERLAGLNLTVQVKGHVLSIYAEMATNSWSLVLRAVFVLKLQKTEPSSCLAHLGLVYLTPRE